MLCSQLTYVVGEVLRFTSIDVLEPLWGDMQARLLNAGNMDEVGSGSRNGRHQGRADGEASMTLAVWGDMQARRRKH
jgi:hypothetical protein